MKGATTCNNSRRKFIVYRDSPGLSIHQIKQVIKIAVEGIPYSAALVVVYQAGVSPLGTPLTRQKTFNSIRFDAPEEAVYDAAHGLFGLTEHPVLDVFLRKTWELTEED